MPSSVGTWAFIRSQSTARTRRRAIASELNTLVEERMAVTAVREDWGMNAAARGVAAPRSDVRGPGLVGEADAKSASLWRRASRRSEEPPEPSQPAQGDQTNQNRGECPPDPIGAPKAEWLRGRRRETVLPLRVQHGILARRYDQRRHLKRFLKHASGFRPDVKFPKVFVLVSEAPAWLVDGASPTDKCTLCGSPCVPG